MTYTETVTEMVPTAVTKTIEVPDGLVRLVNGHDKEFGRNGYHYMGCERANMGGTTYDRICAYIHHHRTYHELCGHPCNCPIKP